MDGQYFQSIDTNKDAALLEFRRDGKTATIDVVNGSLGYGGDLEVDTSARLLFDYLVNIVGAEWLASKLAPGGAS
jgi:hypothetical protein